MKWGGSLTVLSWQTPDVFDVAQSCQHRLVLFVNCCSFRHAERLDHVSMVALKDNKRLHATRLPAADVYIGNVRGVVHDVWKVDGYDTVAVFRAEVRSQHWRQQIGRASCRERV